MQWLRDSCFRRRLPYKNLLKSPGAWILTTGKIEQIEAQHPNITKTKKMIKSLKDSVPKYILKSRIGYLNAFAFFG